MAGTLLPLSRSGVLHVRIDSATGLKSKDTNGYSDPYVKVALGGNSFRTKTHKKTLDPMWGESFACKRCDDLEELRKRSLTLDCYDDDTLGLDDKLGSTKVDLRTLRLTAFEEEAVSVPLDDGQTQPATVTLTLTWTPLSLGELHIQLIRASGLKSTGRDKSDPFVEVRLGSESQHRGRSRTIKDDTDPEWNELLATIRGDFEMIMKQETLAVSAWDDDKMSSPDLLGKGVIELLALALGHGHEEIITVTLDDGQATPGKVHCVLKWVPDPGQVEQTAASGGAPSAAVAAPRPAPAAAPRPAPAAAPAPALAPAPAAAPTPAVAPAPASAAAPAPVATPEAMQQEHPDAYASQELADARERSHADSEQPAQPLTVPSRLGRLHAVYMQATPGEHVRCVLKWVSPPGAEPIEQTAASGGDATLADSGQPTRNEVATPRPQSARVRPMSARYRGAGSAARLSRVNPLLKKLEFEAMVASNAFGGLVTKVSLSALSNERIAELTEHRRHLHDDVPSHRPVISDLRGSLKNTRLTWKSATPPNPPAPRVSSTNVKTQPKDRPRHVQLPHGNELVGTRSGPSPPKPRSPPKSPSTPPPVPSPVPPPVSPPTSPPKASPRARGLSAAGRLKYGSFSESQPVKGEELASHAVETESWARPATVSSPRSNPPLHLARIHSSWRAPHASPSAEAEPLGYEEFTAPPAWKRMQLGKPTRGQLMVGWQREQARLHELLRRPPQKLLVPAPNGMSHAAPNVEQPSSPYHRPQSAR